MYCKLIDGTIINNFFCKHLIASFPGSTSFARSAKKSWEVEPGNEAKHLIHKENVQQYGIMQIVTHG